MTSKKQKDRKKKIQEMQKARQTGSLERRQTSSLLERLSKLHGDLKEAQHDLTVAQAAHEKASKLNVDLERKLKARERDVTEMHNNHIRMRESLTLIREMHQPTSPTYDVDDGTPCMECGRPWPCPTYRKIRTPDHAVVSSLLDIMRTLEKEGK